MGESIVHAFLSYICLAAKSVHAFPTSLISEHSRVVGPPTRSPGSILAWCIVTIAACAWVCIKPNFFKPRPSDTTASGQLKRVMQGLGIMCVLIVAPESVVVWAGRQYYSAGEISKRHEARGWTRTHAFFIIMGGFSLHDSDGEFIRTLDIDELEQLESEGKVSWPTITKEEISNLQGRRNTLLNIVAGFEIAWFIMNTIVARGVQGLVTAQVEIMTFALTMSMLGWLTFLWRDKPCGVRSSVLVLMKKDHDEEMKTQNQSLPSNGNDKEYESLVQTPISKFFSCVLQFFLTSPKWLLLHPDKLPSLFHQHGILSALTYIIIDLIRIPLFVISQPFKHFFLTLWNMLTCSNIKSTFYSPKLQVDANLGLMYALGIFAASIYGTIYISTWIIQPSSYTDQWKWSMDLALTVAAGAPMIFFLVALVLGGHLRKSKSSWTLGASAVFTYVLASVFLLSRVVLIINAVVEFRSLPAVAFAPVDWVSVLASATYYT